MAPTGQGEGPAPIVLPAAHDLSAWEQLGVNINSDLQASLDNLDRLIPESCPDAALLLTRAMLLNRLGASEMALPALQAVTRGRAPASPAQSSMAHQQYAIALATCGRGAEAVAQFDLAQAQAPSEWAIGFLLQRSFWQLTLGNFAEGFAGLEALAGVTPKMPGLPDDAQLWRREDAVEGKTVLLAFTGGFGDSIQMARYLPLILARSGNIIVEASGGLRELFSSSFGDAVAQFVCLGDERPGFDLWTTAERLPFLFGGQLAATAAYLRPSAQTLARWSGATRGVRVGIAWSGSQLDDSFPVFDRRSIALQRLSSIIGEFETVGLQRECRDDDRPALDRHPKLVHLGAAFEDFSDTAAVIAQLDLVVTIDTVIAHLGCALGKPTWVMLPHMNGWPWMRNRADTPWYPTARLFRQPSRGDWDGVITDVHAALADFIA
jgi:hypothetical protein